MDYFNKQQERKREVEHTEYLSKWQYLNKARQTSVWQQLSFCNNYNN